METTPGLYRKQFWDDVPILRFFNVQFRYRYRHGKISSPGNVGYNRSSADEESLHGTD